MVMGAGSLATDESGLPYSFVSFNPGLVNLKAAPWDDINFRF